MPVLGYMGYGVMGYGLEVTSGSTGKAWGMPDPFDSPKLQRLQVIEAASDQYKVRS